MHYGSAATTGIGLASGALILCLLPGCGQPGAEATAAAGADGETGSVTRRAYPLAKLANENVSIWVYLPDAQKGHYRGKRFDWSGHLARVTWKGHIYFGPFRKADKPRHHDANAAGPAGEFGMDAPLGYEEANPGETFLKIGVGKLRKARDAPYSFHGDYEMVEPGRWEIEKGQDGITFRQTMDGDRGWAYEYSSRTRLLADEPGFAVTRTLRNTGEKEIDTAHYAHNFVSIDGVPVGPGYRAELPLEIPAGIDKDGVEVDGRTLTFAKPLKGSLFIKLRGCEGPQDNMARIVNTRTGAGIEINGDVAPVKYNLYAQATALCPEPFIAIKLAPGGSQTWTTTYRLFETGRE